MELKNNVLNNAGDAHKHCGGGSYSGNTQKERESVSGELAGVKGHILWFAVALKHLTCS